jgi:hypothetical protein
MYTETVVAPFVLSRGVVFCLMRQRVRRREQLCKLGFYLTVNTPVLHYEDQYLLLFVAVVAVRCENLTEHIKIVCG